MRKKLKGDHWDYLASGWGDQEWTDDPNGDIYLVTSDDAKLQVSKEKLAYHSEMFRDMFSFPNSYTLATGTKDDPIKIQETKDVFGLILLHIYFRKFEYIGVRTLTDYFGAIRASRKYMMPQVTASLVHFLKSHWAMEQYPGRIYAFACSQNDLSSLVDAAAKTTLSCGILNVDMVNEGDLITGRQYQDLVNFHRRRTRSAVDHIDKLQTMTNVIHYSGGCSVYRQQPEGVSDPERNVNHSHFKCSCNKGIEGPPLWLLHFCTHAKIELNRAPVSDNIFSAMAVLDVLYDLPCRHCASSMRKYWPEVMEFKILIDQLPTSIRVPSS